MAIIHIERRIRRGWCGIQNQDEPLIQILSEGLFKSNQRLGVEALAPLCRGLRDQIIAQAQSRLFI